MSYEIRSRLSQFINRCDQLQAAFARAKAPMTPLSEVGRSLITDSAGELASDLFGISAAKYGRKLAKSYLKSEREKQVRQAIESYESQFALLLNEFKDFLSTVSIDKSGLLPPGNSSLLLGKLTSIHRAVNLETRIRRMAQVLRGILDIPLVYNTEISTRQLHKQKQARQEAYASMKELETELRRLIEQELSKITSDWWKQHIPGDIRINAEDRKATSEALWPWYESGASSLVSYLDFNDYSKIILRADNWRDVFVKVFSDKDLVAAKLRELDPIRKTIAHSRDLSRRDEARLKVDAEDILAAIRKYHGTA